jgi:hypothetical protein
MSWYGNYNESSKKLDSLLEKLPTLEGLLSFPDFLQQLKAYNPKLLDYISNSNEIIKDIIKYLTETPKENDS